MATPNDRSIDCPNRCRQSTQIGENGVESLSKNFLALDILEKKDNDIVKEKDICSQHPGKERDLWCENDKAFICSKCAFSAHKGHEISVASDLAQENLSQITGDMDKLIGVHEMLEDVFKKLDAKTKKIKTNRSKAELEVKQLVKTLRNKINRAEKKALSQIKIQEMQLLQNTSTFEVQLENAIDESNKSMETALQLTENKDNDVLLITKGGELVRTIQSILDNSVNFCGFDEEAEIILPIDRTAHGEAIRSIARIHGRTCDYFNAGACRFGTTCRFMHIKSQDECKDDIPFLEPVLQVFDVNGYLDVMDTVQKWVPAIIKDVEDDAIFIHYLGWSAKYDEWISINSARLAYPGTRVNWKQLSKYGAALTRYRDVRKDIKVRLVDVLDADGFWCVGEISWQMKGNEVEVHCCGFDRKSEWIDITSDRLQPVNTRTYDKTKQRHKDKALPGMEF